MFRRMPRKRGFTLVELLVVIGIIALLISILLPTLNRVRKAGRQVACQSNLRQLGQAIHGYAAENKAHVPWGFMWNTMNYSTGQPIAPNTLVNWATLLDNWMSPQMKNPLWNAKNFSRVFKCPEVSQDFRNLIDYGFNSVAMPSLPYEISGGWDTGDKTPPGQPLITTASLTGMYPDNAILWDTYANNAFGPGTAYGTFGERWSFVDGSQLMNPSVPQYRFRIKGSDPYAGDNTLDQPSTIFMWSPETFSAFNQDESRSDGIRWNYHEAAPRFRHGSEDICNTLFADGSVKALALSKVVRLQPYGQSDSEFKRYMIMIKWPNNIRPNPSEPQP